jgi:hypothetical protein
MKLCRSVRLGRALEEACRTRQGQPHQAPREHVAGEQDGERRGNPQAQTEKTVHRLPGDAVPQPLAQPDNDIARTILFGEQVRHPPHRQAHEHETPDRQRLHAHHALTIATRISGPTWM